MFRRIFLVFLSSIVFASVFSIPAFATQSEGTSDYAGAVSIWDAGLYHWAVEQNGSFILGGLPQDLAGALCESVCGQSEDLLHHTSSVSNEFETDSKGSYTWATCKYCQERFKVYSSDLKSNYNNQVDALPAQSYNSDGALYYTVPDSSTFLCALNSRNSSNTSYSGVFCPHKFDIDATCTVSNFANVIFDCENRIVTCTPFSVKSTFAFNAIRLIWKFRAPIDGFYTLLAGQSVSGYDIHSNGSRVDINRMREEDGGTIYYTKDLDISDFYGVSYSSYGTLSYQYAFLSISPHI